MRVLLSFVASISLSNAIEFDPARQISTYAGYAAELIPADLDGDGDMDLLTQDFAANVVTWYENRGRGELARVGLWERTGEESVSAVSDFDGDGLPDLLLATHSEESGDVLRIQFGAGLGGFGPREQALDGFAGDEFFPRLVVHDVDGSGRPDIVANEFTLLDPGDGTPVKVDAGPVDLHFTQVSLEDLRWEDWTGDGLPDVIHRTGTWWENLGGGRFSDSRGFSPGVEDPKVLRDERLPGGRALLGVARDAEGRDPRLQLLVEDDSGGLVEVDSVPLGNGRDGWTFRGYSKEQEGEPVLASIQNWRRTAEPDVFDEERKVLEISLRFRGGKPSLMLKTILRLPQPAGQMIRADMDGDGRNDLWLQSSELPGYLGYHGGGRIQCHRSNKSGGFRQKPDLFTSSFTADRVKQLVDFDGDGDLDLLTEGFAFEGRGSEIAVWLNRDQAGSFDRRLILSSEGQLRIVSVADRNGDGRSDIMASESSWRFDGKGVGRMMLSLSSRGSVRRVVTVAEASGVELWYHEETGDWDGDGVEDILIWNVIFPVGNTASEQYPVRWAKGLGRNRFGGLQSLGESPGETLYDADGDGDLDLVAREMAGNFDPERDQWRENIGGGNPPVEREFLRIPGDPASRLDLVPARADLDLDGRMDFVASTAPALAQDDGGFTLLPSFPKGLLSFHDVDGDGDADALMSVPLTWFDLLSSLSWFENLGGAMFSGPRELEGPTAGDSFRTFHVGDLNGDGTPDIVSSTSQGRPRIDLFLGKPE